MEAMEPDLKQTPLHEWHLQAGGRMVPFAGWDMPVYYQGITREVLAVRQRAGLFDVSHMGRLELEGPGARDLLQLLTVNDVAVLGPGAGQYSLMLRPDGGILDDLIVYRATGDGWKQEESSGEKFLVIVNASNKDKIVAWISQHLAAGVRLQDVTGDTALLALQGPDATSMAQAMGAGEPPQRFHLAAAVLGGAPAQLSRTGYTGEDGLEIILPADRAAEVWEQLVERGAEPCGLGARDTLRLEAAYCLYGHEISEAHSPLDAGLSWVVKWKKGNFIGREALAAQRDAGLTETLVGLEMDERSVPRQGQEVHSSGRVAGRVTSGTFSPTLQRSIALAYLPPDLKAPGIPIELIAGDKSRKGRTCRLPFYRSERLK